ncbi:hypothetical protein EBR96_00130 [bacterium]|nr:hypothetical protein [bacterium]
MFPSSLFNFKLAAKSARRRIQCDYSGIKWPETTAHIDFGGCGGKPRLVKFNDQRSLPGDVTRYAQNRCPRSGNVGARGARFIPDNQSDTRHFPRQTKAPYRNLADYVAFPDQKVGLCVVTAGNQETLIRNLMDSGQAGLALAVHAVMVQSAEAATEFIHAQLRAAASGKPLAPLTEDQMTHASYEGKRFSFGYSACPNLEDQDLFFNALPIQDSGLRLTDTFMIAPEATVTALVFTHPEAVYFSAT